LSVKGLILFLTKEEKLEEARRDVYEWLKNNKNFYFFGQPGGCSLPAFPPIVGKSSNRPLAPCCIFSPWTRFMH